MSPETYGRPIPARPSIRATVLVSFAFVALATLLLIGGEQLAIRNLQLAVRSMRENELAVARIITAANAALRGWGLPVVNHIVEDSAGAMARSEREMAQQHALASQQLAALAQLQRFPERGRVVLDEIRQTLERAAQTHADVLRLSATQHKAEAARLFREQLRPALDDLEGQMGEFRDLRQAQLEHAVAAAEQQLGRDARRLDWLAGATLLCAGVLTWAVVRRISRGVREVVGAAAAVARDVLHQDMPAVPTADELGYLTNTLAALRCALETSLVERAAALEHARKVEADLAHAARVSTLGEMASGLAHELTQPLAAIAGYTQACLERLATAPGEPAALQAALCKTAAQTQRAGAIIQRMRGFVRRQPAQREALEIDDLVHQALAFMDHELQRSQISVLPAPRQAPLLVWGNRIELEQVIINLVRNGLEAMSGTAEPRLTIRTAREEDGRVAVSIADRGVGLGPAVRERLFQPFFSTKPAGIGLGLAISRTTIEAHDGRLSAECNAGGGATFTFTLPIYRGHDDADAN